MRRDSIGFGGLETLAGLAATVGAAAASGSASGSGGAFDSGVGGSITLPLPVRVDGEGKGIGTGLGSSHLNLPPPYGHGQSHSGIPLRADAFIPAPPLGTATHPHPHQHSHPHDHHHPSQPQSQSHHQLQSQGGRGRPISAHAPNANGNGNGANVTLGTITNIDEDLTRNPIARTLAKERRTCKSFNGEVVWPPKVEAALVQGLSVLFPLRSSLISYLYTALEALLPSAIQSCVSKANLFPDRNKFCANYIKDKTGYERTPRQVGSRIQMLRGKWRGSKCE